GLPNAQSMRKRQPVEARAGCRRAVRGYLASATEEDISWARLKPKDPELVERVLRHFGQDEANLDSLRRAAASQSRPSSTLFGGQRDALHVLRWPVRTGSPRRAQRVGTGLLRPYRASQPASPVLVIVPLQFGTVGEVVDRTA